MRITAIADVVKQGLASPGEGSGVLFIAVASLIGSVIVIAILFASRITKSHYEKRTGSLRLQYQKILNKIVVNEQISEKGVSNAAFEFYLAELRSLVGRSGFSRQLLLTQILAARKSLTGKSAAALIKTYYELQLYRQSLQKLKSRRWQRKALAIRELAVTCYRESAPEVARFLYSGSATLREESFMALVRLEDKPLAFLNGYKGDLSLWMRINIYRYLQNMDHQQLPLFSAYFDHPNLSVRLFSIRMARRFKQTSSLPAIAELLYSDNAKVVGQAISALGEMEAFEYREDIVRLSLHVWNFEGLSKRVVQCLGRIGEQEDVVLLGKFLDHPCYPVRFEAVGALKKFGIHGEAFLQTFSGKDPGNIEGILRHFSEPLLS
jgi:hypothetical protein